MPNYYFLTIRVTDGDFFDSAFFHIYIDNINDVHPVITNPSIQPLVITLPEVNHCKETYNKMMCS